MMPEGIYDRIGKGRKYRYFTPEEDAVIHADYADYVPTLAIASKLSRDEGTVLQRIYRLGLKRSNHVSRVLGYAPDHLRPILREHGPDAFLQAVDKWLVEQAAIAKNAEDGMLADRAESIAATCREIDNRLDLTRNDKLIAKRLAGMTLEAISKQHGLTRVRQLTDPEYIKERRVRKVADAPNNGQSIKALQGKIERHQIKLNLKCAEGLRELWEAASADVRAAFLAEVAPGSNYVRQDLYIDQLRDLEVHSRE